MELVRSDECRVLGDYIDYRVSNSTADRDDVRFSLDIILIIFTLPQRSQWHQFSTEPTRQFGTSSGFGSGGWTELTSSGRTLELVPN